MVAAYLLICKNKAVFGCLTDVDFAIGHRIYYSSLLTPDDVELIRKAILKGGFKPDVDFEIKELL